VIDVTPLHEAHVMRTEQFKKMVLVLFIGIYTKSWLSLRYFSAAIFKNFVANPDQMVIVRRSSSVKCKYGDHGGFVALGAAYGIRSERKHDLFGISVLRGHISAVQLLMNEG
jgi:hypothetical protein